MDFAGIYAGLLFSACCSVTATSKLALLLARMGAPAGIEDQNYVLAALQLMETASGPALSFVSLGASSGSFF